MPRFECLARLAVAAGPLSLFAVPDASSWPATGLPVCGTECRSFGPRAISDGAGGAYVAWTDAAASQTTDYDCYVQRITIDGEIAPGWPARGIPVCDLPRAQLLKSIASDGSGGVLIVWVDHRDAAPGPTSQDVYAQRILGDGTIAPGWSAEGVPVTRALATQDLPEIVSDGAGGAYVTWIDDRDYVTSGTNIYAQRILANGERAPGWPEHGLPVCREPSAIPAPMVVDDQGGVFVVWTDMRRGGVSGSLYDVYAQRIGPEGAIRPGWPENGRLLLADRGLAGVDLMRPAPGGGFYLAYARAVPEFLGLSDYFVQRFEFQGDVSPGWPEGGVLVCAAAEDRFGLSVADDGFGGVLLAWYDYRNVFAGSDVYASRVLPSGALAPGWPADGILVSDPGVGREYIVDVAPDGFGGAYVTWESSPSTDFTTRLQHLTPGGSVAPGWPQFGMLVTPTPSQFTPLLVPDGAGGVLVVWDEGSGGRHGLFASRYALDGPVSARVSIAGIDAAFDRVVLRWTGTLAAGASGDVERKTEGTDWVPLGSVESDGRDRLRFEDATVSSGIRYAYRLRVRDGSGETVTAESWVEVPGLAFALAGFETNPTRVRPRIRFTLPTAARATLEVFDVRGRSVLMREVGSLGAGLHVVDAHELWARGAGVYWMRLRQAERVATARGLVLP